MQVTKISANEFLTSHFSDQVTIVDVRTIAEVSSEYIESAISLPLHKLNENTFLSAINKEPKTTTTVYLLCQGGIRAETATKKLSGLENINLVIIEGGLNQLKALGIALKKGKNQSISLERQVRIIAGGLTITGVILGSLFDPLYYGLSVFVGAGLMFAGITNRCGMAIILAKMPWNT